jgi:hypothetical protein
MLDEHDLVFGKVLPIDRLHHQNRRHGAEATVALRLPKISSMQVKPHGGARGVSARSCRGAPARGACGRSGVVLRAGAPTLFDPPSHSPLNVETITCTTNADSTQPQLFFTSSDVAIEGFSNFNDIVHGERKYPRSDPGSSCAVTTPSTSEIPETESSPCTCAQRTE